MRTRLADIRAADPRLAQARELLRQVHHEAASRCRHPRPPDPARTAETEALLARFADLRGAPTWYPYLGTGVGNGVLVELYDGSIKYDCISGIGVHGWGHGHPDLLDAGLDAVLEDVVMQGHLQQNPISVTVSERLRELARGAGMPMDHVLLTTSGAMANENALKIALQARAPADRVLAFRGNFCGRSLAMAAISDKPQYRDGLPLALAVDYLPFCCSDDVEGSIAACLARLEEAVARHPGRHACLLAELVQGEGGFYPGHPAFFRALFGRCRELGILVMVDEIQTFGRLERGPFAAGHYGVGDLVDICTVGKISQVCATCFRAGLAPRPGLVSQTFTGATHALHVAARVLTAFRDDGLFGDDGRIAHMAGLFRRGLEKMLPGPYGIGGMLACTPCGGDAAQVKALCQRLFAAGVIAFVAGSSPTRLRFLPPLAVITDDQIEEILGIVAACLQEVGHA